MQVTSEPYPFSGGRSFFGLALQNLPVEFHSDPGRDKLDQQQKEITPATRMKTRPLQRIPTNGAVPTLRIRNRLMNSSFMIGVFKRAAPLCVSTKPDLTLVVTNMESEWCFDRRKSSSPPANSRVCS